MTAELSHSVAVKIASAQKWLLWTILLLIAINFVSIGLTPVLDNERVSPLAKMALSYGFLAALLAIVVCQIFCVIRLCLALGEGWATVIYVLFQFVPCLSLIMLLFLNGRATNRLQAAGIRVGLMGARAADVAAYQSADRVKCPACGEAIERGISPCPLCGAAIEST